MSSKTFLVKNVPFYPNRPDGEHCTQASLKSVLKYFMPEKEFSWSELDKLTAYLKGKGSWLTKGLINLHKMGLEVKEMSTFDDEAFINRGGDYLIERYGKDNGTYAIVNSDIPAEQKLYKEFQKLGIHTHKAPTLDDIKNLLNDGYLVCCSVNSKALNNKPGFVGHVITVLGYDDNNLILHDPGLPPLKERHVPNAQFEKAWSIPSEDSRLLYAFRLRSS